jgi:hypothetical protein
MTEQIRRCHPVRWDGIRSITALRIRHYDEQGHAGGRSSISEKKNHWPFGKIKFFHPNGRWWHIPGNWRARRNVQSGYGYPGRGLAPQDGHKTRPRRDPEMSVPGMNDQRDLEGLSALITGATSGIGRAAAEELGRHGAEIVVRG